MNSYYAYSFLFGIYIGGYTNLFSKVVISGLVIYIVHPDNFNPKRFTPLYNQVYEKISPYISKIYELNTEDNKTSSLPSLNSPLPIKTLKLNK